MRTLVIAYEYPWPSDSGTRMRLLTTLRSLVRSGPVDLFSVLPRRRDDIGDPDPSAGIVRVGHTRVGHGAPGLGDLVHPLTPSDLPMGARRAVGDALAGFAVGPYDLAWYFDVRAWVLAAGGLQLPAVVDLNDLEDRKIRARLSIPRVPGPDRPRPARGDRRPPTAGTAYSRLEARRWARLYRTSSATVRRTVVCSELDARRASSAGVARVSVLPNTYPRPARPVGRSDVGSPPVVLFHGTMRYPPNTDAARWLVEEIAPALRAEVPDVRIRLVGRANPAQAALHHPPATTVVGPVPDIDVELANADVVVVPLRFGSGTRVKIIEAFAHRVPVVSTPLGAEGLGVEDGRHLLLAGSASALASACARLLTDLPLRRRLVEAAHRHYLDSFESACAEEAVADIVRRAGIEP